MLNRPRATPQKDDNNMPTTIRSSAIVLLLSVLSGAAFAASTGVYKWVDERGMVHYSGQPTEQKREDLASVRARYDAEKERWRSIIANQERATSAASGPSATTSGATPVRAQSGTTAAK